MAKPYKKGKKGAGRFVQLSEWLQKTEAWRSLPPGPRALYIELKRRFNGSNNGEIFLSHRDAALALNVTRNTIKGYYDQLVDRGFIHMTRAPHLGPSGVGRSTTWALAEERTSDGNSATMAFKKWKSPA